MRLTNGQHFPTITASRVDGGDMTLPESTAGKWTVLLFYRGHWCPYCRQQLMDFQHVLEQFHEIGAEVVALSVDTLEKAQETVTKHHLTFPVLYGLDARDIAQKIGAFINEDPLYLQATGFVLQPDGAIAVSVSSSGAIGRLVAPDTLNFIKYMQHQTH